MNPLITSLGLEPNIEGGYYRQTYESAARIQTPNGPRALANTIYYLLTSESPFGYFHLNRSDITHFFHSGEAIEYLLVSPDGRLRQVRLGRDDRKEEVISFTCPGGWWKSSHLSDGHSHGLISEITTPGFHPDDHRMADLAEFGRLFPHLIDTCGRYISR